jgi:hypothetical protein
MIYRCAMLILPSMSVPSPAQAAPVQPSTCRWTSWPSSLSDDRDTDRLSEAMSPVLPPSLSRPATWGALD